jgi:hypothetical protein
MGYNGAAMVSFFREIIVSSHRPLIPTVPSLVRAAQALGCTGYGLHRLWAAQAMGCTGPGLHGYSDDTEQPI